MNMQPRTLLSLFASLFLAAGPSDAQIAANPSKDEVVELSPFTVSSEKDHGYAAQETLSGTRMRTNLRDVSAAMSVLTPAFMQDLAVTNFVDALLYTPSVDTIGGVNAGSNRDAGGFLMYAQDNAYPPRAKPKANLHYYENGQRSTCPNSRGSQPAAKVEATKEHYLDSRNTISRRAGGALSSPHEPRRMNAALPFGSSRPSLPS